MVSPQQTTNEEARLKNLQSYRILDTLPEEDYDNITALASQICDVPISLISLIDDKRQWFKSRYGIDASEAPREISFCNHVILNPHKTFEIADATKDDLFKNNPFVTGAPNIVYCSGVPLVSDEGFAMGALCVMDNKSRQLTEVQKNALKKLSRQVVLLMNLRKRSFELEETLNEKEKLNHQLDNFAGVAAHDIKAPLSNIIAVIEELKENKSLNSRAIEDITLLELSAQKLRSMVSGLLEYSSAQKSFSTAREKINISELVNSLKTLLRKSEDISIYIDADQNIIYANKVILELIFLNLFSNSIRYNNKEKTRIDISMTTSEKFYTFSVRDNGPGIDVQYHEEIFTMFKVAASRDKFGENGNGIGLATVKRIIDNLHGTIEVISSKGEGAEFIFTLPLQ